MALPEVDLGGYKLGWNDGDQFVYRPRKGLNEKIVEDISYHKNEPEWIRNFRLKSLKRFEKKPMLPWFANNMPDLDFDDIYYYIKPTEKQVTDWDMLPDDIRKTYDRLGVPEAEKKYLAGVSAMYDSEVVMHKNHEELAKQGVIFCDTDTAVRDHFDIVQKYLGTVIPPGDNKFAALNSAVWSGGSFIYVPAGVKVEMPLQAYFRINSENAGQFERTLIIAEEGSSIHYVEGCSAPIYAADSLHSAVVELIAKPGAHIHYTTIQNWSPNVYNLVTKRALAEAEATVQWTDVNMGCLAEGSTVTTRSGPKPIELVVPGEEVLSFDESSGELCFRSVTAKRKSGRQPVREVRSGMRSLWVTDNHPFLSFRYDSARPRKLGRYELSYVPADELEKAIVPISSIDYGEPHKLRVPDTTTEYSNSNQWGARFTVKRERAQRLFVDSFTTDDMMWLFGLFTGDGSVQRKFGVNGGTRWAKVVFSVPNQDRARDRLMEVMASIMPGVWPTERKDGIALSWNSVELADFITENGFATGALQKRIPEWVLQLPESQRLAFVAGYLDSDGCFVKDIFQIKSANKSLLEDVAKILTSLGIPVRIHTESDEETDVMILGYQSRCRGVHKLCFRPDERLISFVTPAFAESYCAEKASQ